MLSLTRKSGLQASTTKWASNNSLSSSTGRVDGSVNVGLTGTYINPVGGEWLHSRKYYGIPARFDDDEPIEEHFVEQDDVMFLAMSPLSFRLLSESLPEDVDSIQKRILHMFVKRLADGSRLRMKFPQYKGPVVLDFPLDGSNDALLASARQKTLFGRKRW